MKIHHLAITVDNLDKSKAFYAEMFGFTVVQEFARKDMDARAAFMKLGECAIELWEFKGMQENKDNLSVLGIRGIRHFALEVENLDAAVAKLHARGLKFSAPALGGSGHRYAFTSDPSGIPIELYEK